MRNEKKAARIDARGLSLVFNKRRRLKTENRAQ